MRNTVNFTGCHICFYFPSNLVKLALFYLDVAILEIIMERDLASFLRSQASGIGMETGNFRELSRNII